MSVMCVIEKPVGLNNVRIHHIATNVFVLNVGVVPLVAIVLSGVNTTMTINAKGCRAASLSL